MCAGATAEFLYAGSAASGMSPCLSRPLQSNLTWGILPFVLALTLITMAMAPLWRYRARSLMGRFYYNCRLWHDVSAR